MCSRFLVYVFAVCVFMLLPVSPASATEHQYIWEPAPPVDCTQPDGGHGGNGRAGYLTRLESSFNSSTKVLIWTATFAPCNNTLPDGYWNVINNGPNPKGHAGELAIFYVDGTDPGNLKVTIYAYNGENGFRSFRDGIRNSGQCSLPGDQAPDRVASSLVDSSFILESFMDDNPDGTRTIHLKIDATDIINHVPNYPNHFPINDPCRDVDSWYGAGFDSKVGYWFHPITGLSTEYCGENDPHAICQNVVPGQSSEGYLKVFTLQTNGWYDHSNRQTNTVPYCIVDFSSSSIESMLQIQSTANSLEGFSAAKQQALFGPGDNNHCLEAPIGQLLQFSVTGHDPDGDSLFFTHSGEPAAAVITPPNGTWGPQTLTAEFSWTPAIEDENSNYEVFFNFEDNHQFPASVQCRVPVCVPDCPPELLDECGVCGGDGSSCISCQGTDITALLFELDGTGYEQLAALRKSLRLLNRRGTRPRANRRYFNRTWAEGQVAQLNSWHFTWALSRMQFQCEPHSLCVSVSNVSNLDAYMQSATELFNLNERTIRRLRRQFRRDRDVRNPRIGRARLAEGRQLLAKAEGLVLSVPSSNDECKL